MPFVTVLLLPSSRAFALIRETDESVHAISGMEWTTVSLKKCECMFEKTLGKRRKTMYHYK
jgi:hypothetical protein